jgi:hypothetical protein
MPSLHQITTDLLDRAHHITKLLVGDRGHEREAQLTGRE